jgi:hypothetical protein
MADYGHVSEPVERLTPLRLNLTPLKLMMFELALPQVIKTCVTVVAGKHIH